MRPSTRLRTSLLTALATMGLLPACASTTGASDAAVTPDVAALPDAAPPDAAVPDAPADVITAPDVPQTCPVMPSTRCLSPADSVRNVMFPPGKVTVPDGGLPVPDGAVRPSGCARPEVVSNDCCNTASALREEGGACCYTFCTQACCGRPLRVGGAARVAGVEARRDWGAASPGTSSVDPATRAALAAAWREDARLEHASIASFARFTLELVAQGAPPELVADAQRAGLDEVDHARRCFALAARHGAGDLGPAPLDLSGFALAGSLEDLLDAVIAEGCVGETLSAFLADAQRERATDPAAREALAVIAADESRHAALAWRFAAWALGSRPDLRPAAARAFASALGGPLPRPRREPADVDPAAWNAHGRLTAPQVDRALDEGVRAVIRPCLAALLAQPASTTRSAASA
ncbi:MAG: ferritin-like domain-containing protein [Polyangiales bacterium]